ncbi:MAG: hypothetical protein A2Y23_00795 [Clostridiales bacterium GWB2_37_7]|nr:MAG: hypothetical protein A2Y23_00795 [Clostridiales bacterium GWB2_37_7]
MAITPVFANEKQNAGNIKSQASNMWLDKKEKNDKVEKALKKFFDSNEFDWAEKAIEKMGAMGILNGIGNGYFKPKNNVTHAEAIAMVLKLTGYQKQAEAIKTQPAYFKGLSDPWSYGYLQLALEKGIIIPEEDGKFNPKAPAKRHEVAKYVVRALGMREDALDHMDEKLSFKDATSIPQSSVGYVYVMTELEIMKGTNSEFQPNKPITRAEVAVILDRAESITESEEPNKPSVTFEGTFVNYDEDDEELTLLVNNKTTVYDVNPYAPVYKDSKYYKISSLESGDKIKVILDSQRKIIFIEFINEATASTGQKLSMRNVEYKNLPEELQDIVDTQKLTQSYTAYKFDDSIYLIAARGKKLTGGYTINIDEVYKETIETNKYNLKVVVEIENPGDSATTQAITYPYDVVKLDYFNGIQKVRFINESDSVLAQTTLKSIEEVNIINGTIDYVDAADRKIKLLEKDGVVRTYLIPSNVVITLDNKTVRLSSLAKNMPAAITRVNGVITKLAAQSEVQIIETIQGKIDAIDTTDRNITLLEANNIKRTYHIPTNVAITINNKTSSISALDENMAVVLTRTNGIITKLAATNLVETINGKIDSVDSANDIVRLLGADNSFKAYTIPEDAQITLNNQAVSLSDLAKGMTAVITKTNGVITKLAVQRDLQTIEGILVTTFNSQNKTYISVKVGTVINAYEITSETSVIYNSESATIQSIPLNSIIVIKIENGEVIEVKNK